MITSNMSLCKVAAAARKDVGQVKQHVLAKHADFWERCLKTGAAKDDIATGCFTSSKNLQWVYALAASQGRITLYPMLWYLTTKGVNAMQIDAEGPASYYQPHVMERYVERFRKKGDPSAALLAFQHRNYEKSCNPCDYKGDRDNCVAVLEDGYVTGEYLQDDAIVHFRTFYDFDMGRKRFGHLLPMLEWRHRLNAVRFERTSRRETPHVAWCRGFELPPSLRQAA